MKLLILLSCLIGIRLQAADFNVDMKSLSFSPKVLKISKGDRVTWKNLSYSKHEAMSETFQTGMISPQKKSTPIVFNIPGKFVYHCKVHGPTMSGVIEVGGK